MPKTCTRCNTWAGVLLWWSCQSQVLHSCGLLIHPNSFCGGMFKFNAKFDRDSLLYLLSHVEWDGHIVHMLTQWCLLPPLTSTVKSSFSHMHILVYSPWLPGYINFVQTILITLTMTGLFPTQTTYIFCIPMPTYKILNPFPINVPDD